MKAGDRVTLKHEPGATATLTQCSETIAQIITELKPTGLLAD